MPITSAANAGPTRQVAIIGAGPAGLFAAEHLASAGLAVTVYERMPSPLRKFLLAGRGGLNLTHAEPPELFLRRYGSHRAMLEPMMAAFPAAALRAWADGLGEETFVGSSGRVFPKSFKATPLARAWLRRLEALGVAFAFRHRWVGWHGDALAFESPAGPLKITPDATLLALGGASWPRLGSDGAWQTVLAARGIAITPLVASNVGISVEWSAPFRERHAGTPLKGMAFRIGSQTSRAEAVITRDGLEGGAIYALSDAIRGALATGGARLTIDLKPDLTEAVIAARLTGADNRQSLSNRLRKAISLPPAAIGLLREAEGLTLPHDAEPLATLIKAVSLPVRGLAPIERAISSAGGVAITAVDEGLRLAALENVWVAGEMLDWDAPTGGYLLQADFATALNAARSIVSHLIERKR